MIESIFVLLALLFVKHWYIDFVDQDNEEVQHKGIYLNWLGVKHSLKHGLATAIIFSFTGISPVVYVIIGLIDFLIHYHVDWMKMNWGNRDITTPQFWNHLGQDQMAHYFTYLGLVWLVA